MLKRKVLNQWNVNYEEKGSPHLRAGMVLPQGRYKEFDPFIMLAEDWFKRGTFGSHPHRGFQTITYVIEGRLEHRDNKGGHGILEKGDVQYMNAGSGAIHSEEPVDQDIVHSLQLWLNLPSALKNASPSYQNLYSDQVPSISFEGGTLKAYAGNHLGKEGSMKPDIPFTMVEITLGQGTTFEHVIPANHNAFLYVLSGEIEVGENLDILMKTGVATLTFEEDAEGESAVQIIANKKSIVLVYSGLPIRQPIVPYGPFVMNTMEEIQQAYKDYQDGKFE
jgi:redox-sensitive bicupin YhaK (pirin superfamily)